MAGDRECDPRSVARLQALGSRQILTVGRRSSPASLFAPRSCGHLMQNWTCTFSQLTSHSVEVCQHQRFLRPFLAPLIPAVEVMNLWITELLTSP